MARRRSLCTEVVVYGEGVRSGRSLRVTLGPAAEGEGLRLLRTDTGEAWPLDLSAALALPGCSAIGDPESHVAYVEHLLAALGAAGVTDALVTVDGPELPLLEGSALPWWEALARAGVVPGDAEVSPLVVAEPVAVCEAEAFLLALPAEATAYTYVLEHPHPLVGRQWAEFAPAGDNFAREIAPARTFTTAEEAQRAQELGLLRGGSEANALVLYPDHLSAEPTLPHACARHKLLDLLGDLYLLGRPLVGRIVAYQAGHRANQRLAHALAAQAAASAEMVA